MIADSPYEPDDGPLSPAMGAAAGLAATTAMLLAGTLLRAKGFSSLELMVSIGAVILGTGSQAGTGAALAGALACALLGMLGGVLYAVSQREAPRWAIVGVAVFYGLMLWIAARLVVGRVLGEPAHTYARSWAFLAASEVYALGLAAAALIRSARWPRTQANAEPMID